MARGVHRIVWNGNEWSGTDCGNEYNATGSYINNNTQCDAVTTASKWMVEDGDTLNNTDPGYTILDSNINVATPTSEYTEDELGGDCSIQFHGPFQQYMNSEYSETAQSTPGQRVHLMRYAT